MLLGVPTDEDKELITTVLLPALVKAVRRLKRYSRIEVDLFDIDKSTQLKRLGYKRSMVCVYLGAEECLFFEFELTSEGKIENILQLNGVILDDPLIRVVTYRVDRSAYKQK